jgi:copper chaperone
MSLNLHLETSRNTDILVFRTNLRDKGDVARIAPVLRSERRIHLWTVDLADIDKVLRIEAEELTTGQVNRILRQQGFECEEL